MLKVAPKIPEVNSSKMQAGRVGGSRSSSPRKVRWLDSHCVCRMEKVQMEKLGFSGSGKYCEMAECIMRTFWLGPLRMMINCNVLFLHQAHDNLCEKTIFRKKFRIDFII